MVEAYATMGVAFSHLGEFEKGLEHTDKAIRLSPHDPALYLWYADKGLTHFGLKQYDQAAESARRSIAINPTYLDPHPVLISALGWSGRQAEAHEAIQRYVSLFPSGPKTIAAWKGVRAQETNSDTDPRYLELWDRYTPVQQKLESQTQTRRAPRADDHSFLAGKLYDDRGNRMSASHASKGGRRWRYYVSRAALTPLRVAGLRQATLRSPMAPIARTSDWRHPCGERWRG